LECELADRHPRDRREGEERQEEEVGEKAPPREDERNDGEDGPELRTRTPRAPGDHETDDARDRLERRVRDHRQERHSAVREQEDEPGTASEHRLDHWRHDPSDPGLRVVNDERQVRDTEHRRGDREVARCGAPAALRDDGDDPEGREEPRDLLGRERQAERNTGPLPVRSEEHTSELQSLAYLVCRLLLEKKKPSSYED